MGSDLRFSKCKNCNWYKRIKEDRLCSECYEEVNKGVIELELDNLKVDSDKLGTISEVIEETEKYKLNSSRTKSDGYIAVNENYIEISYLPGPSIKKRYSLNGFKLTLISCLKEAYEKY